MSTTYTRRVQTGGDDVYDSSGTFQAGQAYIYMGDIGGTGYNGGYRFTNVTVPQGATIDGAKLTFQAQNNFGVTTCRLRVFGVDADDYDGFSDSAGDRPRDVTVTTAYVDWTAATWTSGSNYDTPDIKAVVQEIVDRAGWASGNDMSIVIKNNGSDANARRGAKSYENSTSDCALLTITYSTASGPANLKTYNTNAAANIKTINTNAIANVKSLNTNI